MPYVTARGSVALCRMIGASGGRSPGAARPDTVLSATHPERVVQLLERASHLDALGRALAEAGAGAGRLVFVAGEAGVGKTALIQAFAVAARAATLVLRGACDPLSTPRPLGPLIDIAALSGGELAELLGTGAPRHAVFQGFLNVLAGTRRPVLAIVEDVHWADEATLDLLRFTGRRIERTRALLVATYRDDEVGAHHPLRIVLGDLATAAGVRRMTVPPLSVTAVRTLAADSGVDAVELHRQTGGNPFFVSEVLAAGGQGIPATVRDAVLARAARLSLTGRAALEAAAVSGPIAEPWLLAAVAGADAPAVAESVVAGMLRDDARGYSFRHEIARAAVLSAIAPGRRQALQRAALDALRAASQEAAAGPVDLARLAHHAAEAADGAAVLELAPAAARQAARLGAHREAASHYEQALRFAERLPLAARAALLEAYALENAIIDHLPAALAARQQAIALWQRLGDPRRAAAGLSRLAMLHVFEARNADAEQAIRAALDLLAPLAPGLEHVIAYRIQAQIYLHHRDTTEAVKWGAQAISLGERVGDVENLAAAHNAVGVALLQMGDARGRAHLEQGFSVAREAGLDSVAVVSFSHLASNAGEYYQFPRADRYLREGLAFATERDLDSHLYYMLAWQALSHLYQGRWADAADVAGSVLRQPVLSGITRIMALVALGRVRARRGDPDAWSALDEALDLAAASATLQRLGPVHAARAEAAWLASDSERSRSEAQAAWDLALHHRHPWHTGELAYWQWRAADALVMPDWAARPFRLQIAGDWQAAASAWQQLNCPYEEARALAAGDETAQRQALRSFEQLGARPMVEDVTRRLRERGARGIPRGPRPSTRANPAGLTRREREVLELLAAGLRNQEIAARLYLAPKTVERHVSAVLAKLGVRTRTEAAREAARLGLIPQNGGPVRQI
jgi:DNA-binding CsgD family transcriptional regulator/tetratricopeptide (TPR) repeat protein